MAAAMVAEMTDHPLPLVARGLAKRFDTVVALDQVDVSLQPGELLALVGPSGCGKSTLLRSIAGLVSLDAGTIELDGRLVDDGTHQLPPERRSIGLVFQEHALFPHLTVHDNVAFGIRNAARNDVDNRVDELLELVSLSPLGRRYPHELSGGERQRVALARALAPRPALMLFDEPFASLDRNLRLALRHDVVAALRATDTPAVFVTHDQAEALAIGDRIAVMRAGRILQVDAPAAVFHRPVDHFVAGFMGDASFLSLRADGTGHASVLGPVDLGSLPVDQVEALQAMVRPDDVRFDRNPDGPPSASIEAAEYHGSGWMLTVRHDSGEVLLCAASHLDPVEVGARGAVELVPGHRQIVLTKQPSQ